MRIRILSGEDVGRALPMVDAIPLMRDAFGQLSSGDAVIPDRTRIESASGCRTLIMPGYVPSGESLGVKVVSIQPANPARGIPTIHGLMVVADADTGEPRALIEAERLTAIRTGAASGVATDLLANPDASVAAIFGAGRQAVTQLEAIACVRRLEQVFVYSLDDAGSAAFAHRMTTQLGLAVRPAKAPDELLQADIICTATTSSHPVFDPSHLKSGAHINAIGSFTPDVIEIPPQVVARAVVVVDKLDSALRESGELVQTIQAGLMTNQDVHGEIGAILNGAVSGRSSPDEVTLFKSVGNAVQDVASAAVVVNRAEKMGLGSLVDL